MRYLVIGSGGREHVIYWRLLFDGSASEVFVAPGNGGIDPAHCVNINLNRHNDIIEFCKNKKIDFVVIGPEAPLADGVADTLSASGIPVFGPSAKAAKIEGSKIFAKEIMEKSKVPTASHRDFTGKKEIIEFIANCKKYPIVIKLDGLAAGKGVVVAENEEQAMEFVSESVKDNSLLFVEDFLEGEEASVLGISDGETILPFISAQDHKRIYDGDKGPNTGGMGAYAPAPVAGKDVIERVGREIHKPVIDVMKNQGIPFKGILYAGLMIGKENNVLEFNARFGDPEAQVLLPLIDGKIGDLFIASYEGKLKEGMLKFTDKHAITVVMASKGYPSDYEKGKLITGLDSVSNDILVFHAGTVRNGNGIFTNGGRVLAVTAVADSLEKARDKVYSEIDKIQFEGAHYRKDIGYRAFNRG